MSRDARVCQEMEYFFGAKQAGFPINEGVLAWWSDVCRLDRRSDRWHATVDVGRLMSGALQMIQGTETSQLREEMRRSGADTMIYREW